MTNDNQSNLNYDLIENIKFFREKTIKKKKKFSIEQLEKPVTFWIKKDRLINEVGKEFTIILRTKGCNWALGACGGCSMCGYIQDSNINSVSPDLVIKQVNYAFESKKEEVMTDNDNYVIKIFNSGSFFDDNEISDKLRQHMYQKINEIHNVKEVVVESRVDYITRDKLIEMRNSLKKKYIEIGIGLETANDYIRNNYINKGLMFDEFVNIVNLCKKCDIGIKAYLLFKPPFINEQGAIDDCANSIRILIDLKVNTISINPLNIQKETIVEYLWRQNRYRPPWFYSLFKCLELAIKQDDLKAVRILSTPSGAGTIRGIHNCLKRECNENMLNILKNFVLTQDITTLNKQNYQCDCIKEYQLKKNFI